MARGDAKSGVFEDSEPFNLSPSCHCLNVEDLIKETPKLESCKYHCAQSLSCVQAEKTGASRRHVRPCSNSCFAIVGGEALKWRAIATGGVIALQDKFRGGILRQ